MVRAIEGGYQAISSLAMKILGLDGKMHVWDLLNHRVLGDDIRPRSELHLRARALIKSLWATEPLLEEVFLPGSVGLFADFFLPKRDLVVECNGEQHYKLTAHFHGDKAGFLQSQRRDKNKQQWCQINKFELIELPFNESNEQWLIRLKKV